jgi:uncharacterized SAM-binding protein YcdF (DUF218 family)
LDPKSFFGNVAKIAIVGDIIIGFAIIVVLTSLSSAGGYFGLEGEQKQMMVNFFMFIGASYTMSAISYRIYKFIKKGKNK